ncbi:Transmembrane BAX inhibitor motif-containing protein 4 [Halocaridina rubra]|uniref:Transmembrane BAX inhibitor motif-containing protein 4 n=1 Tax=Halocaridina rubra TaxID=373956 RepID=A0AAN8ZR37_HALRR
MSTSLLIPQDGGQAEKGGIVNDFMYGSNVASSHIYIRMGFLRKVYGLLSVQLLVTTVVAACFAYVPTLRDTIHANPWMLIMSIFMALGLLIALHVKRHHVPINFVLLAAFTVVEAITVGVAVSMYEAEVVVKAFVLTLVITAGLTAYTFQTKRDFTNMGAGLLIGLMVIIGLGMMNLFLGSSGLELALAGGAALVFCLFIVFDTQMMMQKLSPEEYILATINLYLDILNLFLELLRLLGDRK